GWSGGPYGVGRRMSIAHTRAIIDAIHSGALDNVETVEDPVFGVRIPTSVPGVPNEVLTPVKTWADKNAYQQTAAKLAKLFNETFKKYSDGASDEVKKAAPRL